jgi:phage terminase large subunit-like protein
MQALAAQLEGDDPAAAFFNWKAWARPAQLPPEGDWTTWLLMGGRGAGKTLAGAQWVRALAAQEISPIALVGETMSEAIAVMVNGQSGLLRVHRAADRPVL